MCRPRGLAGLLLVIKVAGALAEQGKTMSESVDICQKVRGQLRTIGLSASGICAPGQQQAFDVGFSSEIMLRYQGRIILSII